MMRPPPRLKRTATSFPSPTPFRSCLHGDDVRENLFEDVARLYYDLDKGITPLSVFAPYAPTEAHRRRDAARSEEHTSELQSLMRISYAVFCLKKKKLTSAHKRPNEITNYHSKVTQTRTRIHH